MFGNLRVRECVNEAESWMERTGIERNPLTILLIVLSSAVTCSLSRPLYFFNISSLSLLLEISAVTCSLSRPLYFVNIISLSLLLEMFVTAPCEGNVTTRLSPGWKELG
ncbi:hypothetical protein J6590_076133 [Homalodisca vitripennis]|nr:hypothetical protein J6590_076133 [Homalodisca vitripennis]